MFKNLMTLLFVSAFLILTACGGGASGSSDSEQGAPSSGDQGSGQSGSGEEPGSGEESDKEQETTPDVSIHGLSPIASTRMAGIWIGSTEYTEKEEFGDYYLDIAGNRTWIIKLTERSQSADGSTVYYDIVNCYGNQKSGSYKKTTDTAVILGRSMDVTTFNVMTGSSDVSEHGDDKTGDEDWTWIKISDSTADLGSIVTTVDLADENLADPAPFVNNLKSFCQDTHTKTPVGRTFDSETISLDLFGFGDNKNYIFSRYVGGYMDAYLGPQHEHFDYVDSKGETMSYSVSNATVPEYTATYYVSGNNYKEGIYSRGAYDMKADIVVSVPAF
ncbi:MAG: hypothetical protein CMI06_11695 [Oceanospirillaceae bacterium]|nr:hypothetical protein [Oceanospirillaceae bacterium]|tara:strand:+ start:147 stop:1139 length:993 start_codon:yes stop_codon:yes gene_type:complete